MPVLIDKFYRVLIEEKLQNAMLQEMQMNRHPSLYYTDGDIILSAQAEAESPPILVLFRVDKLFLSRHSDVFRDMFAVAPSENVEEHYDGVPLVQMPQDKAEDLALLIEVIYDPPCVYQSVSGVSYLETK